MVGEVLLDTSIVVAHLREDAGVAERLKYADELRLPLVAVGELEYGVGRASDTSKATERLEQFLSIVEIVLPDRTTAKVYGKIKSELAQVGTPIPDNDIWVAATARQHALPLAQRDEHFRRITGLKLLNW